MLSVGLIKKLISYSVPIGSVATFAHSDILPKGYLECNGEAVSRITYSKLFAVISTNYGVGDNSTTFNLPDLRGEFIRGFDNGRGVDSGRTIGSSQGEDTKPHSHSTPQHKHTGSSNSTGSHTHSVKGGFNGSGYSVSGSNGNQSFNFSQNVSYSGSHSHAITINNSPAGDTGNSGTTETRPRNVTMMFCIKI